MSYWVYILRSDSAGRYYCGRTNDLERRVHEHDDPTYCETQTTKRFKGPWKLIWFQERPGRSDAMKLERSIKKRGISRFLREIGAGDPSGC
jgi:putative endonuclease